MPRKSSEPITNLIINRVCQITDSHCGPAVVQMLLAHLGVAVTQEAIAESGGAIDTIEACGMAVDQLARAVKQLQPDVTFWYKDHSKLRELIKILNVHRYPVAVEWQGLFEADTPDDEDVDDGHYSVVTYVDKENKQLIIVDPYKDYVARDRIFSFDEFKRRWWDWNEITDPQTGQAKLVKDVRLMFVITPAADTWPREMEMHTFDD
jgi:hypothetical protein